MYALERNFLVEWKEEKYYKAKLWKAKIVSEFKTAAHHRGVPPDYRFLFLVKSTKRFSSVTLEREVIWSWCSSNWLQIKIKDLAAQPGKGSQASLGQPDPKYLLDFLASVGSPCNLVPLNSDYQNHSGFSRIFFSLFPTGSFYWYAKSFTSVANTYSPTQLAKTNFQELSHHQALLFRLDENLRVSTCYQRPHRGQMFATVVKQNQHWHSGSNLSVIKTQSEMYTAGNVIIF